MCNEIYSILKRREEQLKQKLADAMAHDQSHTEALSK